MTTRMKLIALLSLTFAALSTAGYAFDFNGLKEKASSAATAGESSQLLSLGKQLYDSFGGNATATKYAKGLMGALQTGKYEKAFQFYDKIKSVKLTPAQLDTWNSIKNPISAFVLEQNFQFDESDASALVEKATEALQANNLESATNYLTKLKKAATLSDEQASLLSEIQENVLPVLTGK